LVVLAFYGESYWNWWRKDGRKNLISTQSRGRRAAVRTKLTPTLSPLLP
jgi:hypothetical protein